ncbi:hypothetical protein QR680_008666 [Steinernema hermaphroditum]|uniref:Uncharacterized protein n=1 Tax=Steinernema hermaphroditum TaxID=289476 RepID=A0AA39IHE9_9BILA|nr:hypothetical protein QR680_008666 [Steinernema hermaphroditum]
MILSILSCLFLILLRPSRGQDYCKLAKEYTMTSIAESYDEEYRTALYEDDQMLEKLRALMVIREAACPSEYSFVARFFPFGRPNVPANLHCRVKGGCNDADLEELRRKKSKDFEPPPTTSKLFYIW